MIKTLEAFALVLLSLEFLVSKKGQIFSQYVRTEMR